MDLTYSAEHQAFRREVLVFLEAHRHAAPKGGGAAQRPSAEAVAWQKLLIAHGYAARTIPKAYGGYGAAPDILKSRIIGDEFARAGVPAGLQSQGISMLVPTLLELGTEDQKRQWIGPLKQLARLRQRFDRGWDCQSGAIRRRGGLDGRQVDRIGGCDETGRLTGPQPPAHQAGVP